MDVHLRQNKGWMQNNASSQNRYVISNATIHDMVCQVTFAPNYNATGTMTYNVSYKVLNQNPYSTDYTYRVSCHQVVYNYNKKTKYKALPEGHMVLNMWFDDRIIPPHNK